MTKPCLFCGSANAEVVTPVHAINTEFRVRCSQCFACSPIALTAEGAIELWNKPARPAQGQAPQDVAQTLREGLDKQGYAKVDLLKQG